MINKFVHFIVALLTISSIVFLLFDWVIMPVYIRKEKTIRLIDIKNKKLDRAILELDSEGFKGIVFDTVYTSEIEPQTVIDQYPEPGKKIKKGRTVRLKISRPEKMIFVPNLVGQSKRSSEIALRQIGLEIDTIYNEFNPDYPKGTVAWQFPKAGDYINKGLGIQLTVSQGLPPDFFQVPQLFGLSLNKAKEELARSRLKVGKISYQQNEDLVPYTVLDQSISPGTVLDQSSQINLVISILDLQDIFDKLENEK
jgi:serine/threonine-protein kinase|tara:strand:+ start:802 stop:1563 length:762 start_codon:yes stop_codon:yes gene_type:complete